MPTPTKHLAIQVGIRVLLMSSTYADCPSFRRQGLRIAGGMMTSSSVPACCRRLDPFPSTHTLRMTKAVGNYPPMISASLRPVLVDQPHGHSFRCSKNDIESVCRAFGLSKSPAEEVLADLA